MTTVWVTIPARDEEDDVHACLEHVAAAARAALASGQVGSVTVALAAHRCSDTTQTVTDRVLAEHPELSRLVVADETSTTVGQVRHRLVLSVFAASKVVEPADTWLFTTDADSFMPLDWITGTLAAIDVTDAAAVAGDVELRGWVARRTPGAGTPRSSRPTGPPAGPSRSTARTWSLGWTPTWPSGASRPSSRVRTTIWWSVCARPDSG
ncbi:MAG TPA: hypothetical protein VES01_02525 [Dermatophilaceae bacterium]|nr:hypothetical protein [Dermatophilaceae bacterium]